MKKMINFGLSGIMIAAILLFFYSNGLTAPKVVVVPLGGATGDATPPDVLEGKTFSSKMGKGLTGKLSAGGSVCLGTLSSGGRWCDQEDGTVLDMATGLVWLKKADWGGLKPWRNGSSDCSAPSYICYFDAHSQAGTLMAGSPNAGLSDGSVLGEWRMPTAVEVLSLTVAPESVSSGEMRAFTGVTDDWYWTSTSDLGSQSDAYVINLNTGGQGLRYKYLDARVWPVRAAN